MKSKQGKHVSVSMCGTIMAVTFCWICTDIQHAAEEMAQPTLPIKHQSF